jgi:site-specific recombinase XerD
LAALLAQCRADGSPAGVRDAAVIGLAYLSGTRRAELVALHLADVDTSRAAIRVVGKGGKERLVPLSPTVGPLLEAWMGLRGDSPGPLFCAIDRAGSCRLGHMLTGEAIRQILARRALAAGVAAVSPHDLRRTYAGDLLDAGADLPAVQQLMGHASPSTTSRYDRRGDTARRSAAERLTLDLDRRSAFGDQLVAFGDLEDVLGRARREVSGAVPVGTCVLHRRLHRAAAAPGAGP